MIYYLIGTIILMLIGIIGVVIPVLPGIVLMAVVATIFTIFIQSLPIWVLIIMGLITIFSIIIDHFSGILGARLSGASAKSMLCGFIGMIFGGMIFGFIGFITGLFLGILLGEIYFSKNYRQAIKRAGVGAMSVITGIVINLILAISFLIIFIVGVI